MVLPTEFRYQWGKVISWYYQSNQALNNYCIVIFWYIFDVFCITGGYFVALVKSVDIGLQDCQVYSQSWIGYQQHQWSWYRYINTVNGMSESNHGGTRLHNG